MVWLVEKKVVRHVFDCGLDRVEIPVRVKFEFEVKDGAFVDNSLSTGILFNRKALEKRYPKLNTDSLDSAIEKTVKNAILEYLRNCGYIKNGNDP